MHGAYILLGVTDKTQAFILTQSSREDVDQDLSPDRPSEGQAGLCQALGPGDRMGQPGLACTRTPYVVSK